MSSIRKIKRRHQLFSTDFIERMSDKLYYKTWFAFENILAPTCALLSNPNFYLENASIVSTLLKKEFPEWQITEETDTIHFNSLDATFAFIEDGNYNGYHTHYFPHDLSIINTFYCHMIKEISFKKEGHYDVSLNNHYEILVNIYVDSNQNEEKYHQILNQLRRRITKILDKTARRFKYFSPTVAFFKVQSSVQRWLLYSQLYRMQSAYFDINATNSDEYNYKDHVDFLIQQELMKKLYKLIY